MGGSRKSCGCCGCRSVSQQTIKIRQLVCSLFMELVISPIDILISFCCSLSDVRHEKNDYNAMSSLPFTMQ